MRYRPTRSRGFAIIVAIAMLALVGAAILVITREFSFNMTRTRLATQDAQLRQLLLAGAQDATIRARGWGGEVALSTWQIDLPQPLKQDGATLSLEARPVSSIAVEIRIDARIERRQSSQLLYFNRHDERWTLTDAELGG